MGLLGVDGVRSRSTHWPGFHAPDPTPDVIPI